MQGIDFIMEALISFDAKVDNEFRKQPFYKQYYAEMKMQMKSIHNTNAFMLMAINRCIDFTKESRGLKLVPHLDSVNFHDTLSLPLKCMRNIQNRIRIILLPISQEICPCIITDKQWLQENILCLLSNAVKYSTEGTVTVKVRLQENDEFNFVLPKVKDEDRSISMSSRRKIPRSTRVAHFTDLDSPLKLASPFGRPARKEEAEKQKYLLFEVEDTGIGMDDETVKSLFSAFKQAQRLAGGTGLGLYSLSKRVEALEGKYGVSRRRDGREGSLFWFSIPYRPDHTLGSGRIAGDQSISITNQGRGIATFHQPNRDHRGHVDISSRESSVMSASVKDALELDVNLSPETTIHRNWERVPQPHANPKRLRRKSMTFSLTSLLANDDLARVHTEKDDLKSNDIRSGDVKSSNDSVRTCDLKSNDIRSGEPKTTTEVSIPRPASAARNIGTKRSLYILLVEDCPTISKMTCLMLRRLGHRVELAENGHTGLNMMIKSCEAAIADDYMSSGGEDTKFSDDENHPLAIPKKRYDIVLMDFQMPIMDGLEATKRFREYERKKFLPVIESQHSLDTASMEDFHGHRQRMLIVGLSATSDKETIDEGRKMGLDDVLYKPMNAEVFTNKARQFHLL
jgi:CheY-like chemotaxis protein